VDSSLQEAPHVFSGWGNSGIETTVEDLARWAQALDRRELLSGSSYRQMFKAGRLSADTALNFPFRGARAAYGLGWFLTTDRGDSLTTHGGAIAGFSSVLHRLPEKRWTIIVLSNKKQGRDRQGEAEALAGAVLEALRAQSGRRADTTTSSAAAPVPAGNPVPPAALMAQDRRYVSLMRLVSETQEKDSVPCA
jgi:CubicO group peptidase (beta-lactamase class C family)